MQHVSSFGGPRILLPTQDVPRWIGELGTAPSCSDGLYGLACSVHGYCGIIRPWDTPILVFGDDPADIYWSPHKNGGLFVRWVGADSLQQLMDFAILVANRGQWTERIEWDVGHTSYTLMDSCTLPDDQAPRVSIQLPVGKYVVESVYAQSDDVMTIVQNLRSGG